jgi:hypothetical protein
MHIAVKLRFSKRVATMDEEMQNINRVLKAVRAETVHEIDVALITCANASNRSFANISLQTSSLWRTIPPNSFPFFDNFNAGQDFSPKAYHICGHSAKIR